DQTALAFFEHHLKEEPAADLPNAWAREKGSNRWVRYSEWPPANAEEKTLYLPAKGKLSFEAPADGEAEFDEYVSDPLHPVPYLEHPPAELDEQYMYADQRFAAQRADVLTFVTEPLTEAVIVAGPVSPHLQVSTSGPDS